MFFSFFSERCLISLRSSFSRAIRALVSDCYRMVSGLSLPNGGACGSKERNFWYTYYFVEFTKTLCKSGCSLFVYVYVTVRIHCFLESNTKAMVFSKFRNSVSEIADCLKQYEPLIRPVAFEGRGTGGSRAPKQKKGPNAPRWNDSANEFKEGR